MRRLLLAAAGLFVLTAAPAAADPAAPPDACTAEPADAAGRVALATALRDGACGPRDPARAEQLLREAAASPGDMYARAVAVRMLADLHVAQGRGLADAEALLAPIEAEARGQDQKAAAHARAWLLYRQDRHAEAAAVLEGLTGFMHHTLAIAPIFHDDLGDAYEKLGRHHEAQSQWRLALATRWRPEATGWNPALTAEKIKWNAARHDAGRLLTIVRNAQGLWALDLGSIRREGDLARYDKLVVFARPDADGTAALTARMEIDCSDLRSRRLSGARHDAAGKAIGALEPSAFAAPDMAINTTERRLVCGFDEKVMGDAPTIGALLADYRGG